MLNKVMILSHIIGEKHDIAVMISSSLTQIPLFFTERVSWISSMSECSMWMSGVLQGCLYLLLDVDYYLLCWMLIVMRFLFMWSSKERKKERLWKVCGIFWYNTIPIHTSTSNYLGGVRAIDSYFTLFLAPLPLASTYLLCK